ncbi:MAG: MSEP-CTERM sorting domain-containing protein [Proteiniphilum sp.]|jgi:hypothetical protein|nr:MSEP-CTERM sorting domain-containing protein [Proteiniphilum sp.]
MRNVLNPKWLFIINTLPVIVLLVLLTGQFDIIKTLLDENSIRLWKSFGLALGILGLLNFIHAVYLTVKKQNVSVRYGVIALLLYIPFIYLYGCHLDGIIPSSVPQWMIPESIFIGVGTFLMPTLAYALFVLIVHFTSESGEHKAWINFLIAIAVPVAGYLFSRTILPLWRLNNIGELSIHALLVLIIAATLVFLFFLVRGVFILALKKTAVRRIYRLAWKIPVAIVLPLMGLSVNNGHLFKIFGENNSGIFGDFNNPLFYILVAINGILICLPDSGNKIYRLLLFAGRSVTFACTLYFFLVFLPFLPLSVMAIIAFGAGFLMLTPLLLFVIHISALSADFAYLKPLFSGKLILGLSLSGFLVIPASITATFLKDKSVLRETLSYVYTPDYSKRYSIDSTSLRKTLDVIKYHKDKSRYNILGSRIPYLSSYFNRLVLDNLTLSDTKINCIERIFFGETSVEINAENIRNDSVKITGISGSSVYDKSQNAWISRVDLEITDESEEILFPEYATTIDLPEGCWISDYYLYVGDRKESGILAEKRSAMWVFSNIRNENKDPGILHYLTGNKVALRIFPFSKGEVRKTGIEFLHREPVQLTIDGHTVALGCAEETVVNEGIETGNIIYIPAQQKQTLKKVRRSPRLHFLVDVSTGKDSCSDDFTRRIEKILTDCRPFSGNAQISFVNSYVSTFPLDGEWKQRYLTQTFEGGFYLERAISTTLLNAHRDETRPVIIVVTDNIRNAIIEKDFSDFKFEFPESDLFYNLDESGTLQEHSLTDDPQKQLPPPYREPCFCETVLACGLADGSTVYLPDDNRPSIILKKDLFDTDETEIREKSWLSALTMHGLRRSQLLHPETSGKEQLKLIKYSFATKVMTPATSYLVVENEAQKAALKRKQEEVLTGNGSLDPDEETRRMSEPGLLTLLTLLTLLILAGQKRKAASRKGTGE